MGLRDFFEQMDRRRNDGYERSLTKYKAEKAISDAAEMQAMLPKKKLIQDALAKIPEVLEYKGKGAYREFVITSKDGRSVIVRHPDPVEAANIGEDHLKIERFTGERTENVIPPPVQFDFWQAPVPPHGDKYLSPQDGVVLDLAKGSYSLPGGGVGTIRTSRQRWPGHRYIYNDAGELRWLP